MKEMGYGKDYKYAHDYPDHFVEQQNLPDSKKNEQYYAPGDQGYERQVNDRLKGWWQRRKKPKEPEETEPEIEKRPDEEDLPPL